MPNSVPERGELQALVLAFDRATAGRDRGAAEACALTLLQCSPTQGALLNGVARELIKIGSIEIALRTARAACAAPQRGAQWLMQLAALERQAGHLDAALAAIGAALALDAEFADAWIELAGTHLVRKEPSAAGAALDRAFALGASSLALHVLRSVIAADSSELDLAVEHARSAVAADPTSLVAQINAAMLEGDLCGYEVALRRLDALPPQTVADVTVLRARAGVLLKLGRWTDALFAADAALAVDPSNQIVLRIRVNALRGLGREAEVLAELEAPAAAEAHPRLLVQAAAINMDLGRRDRALRLLRRALVREPDLCCAWYNLVEAGASELDGADIAAMQALLTRDATIAYDRMLLHFALGKALLARDEQAPAFEHFVAGNAAKRRQISRYNVAHDERLMVDLAAEFSSGALAPSALGSLDVHAHPTEEPIFVVGMPRSGTSLVEQLLASHPAVFGAGESNALLDVVARRASIDRADWRSLAESYLRVVRARAGTAERIVDKLPFNFLYVGFIRLLFPNARIIHCRRDPLDRAYDAVRVR